MSLAFDDNLEPNGYHLHPTIRDSVTKLEHYALGLSNYDPLLLRRQLYLLREVAEKLREAGVPDAIVENLHALGEVVADRFPGHMIDLGLDGDDPEFWAAMPHLPDTFILKLDA